MSTFPSLKPSSRTFTPGGRPHSVINTLNGNNVRVRQSSVFVEQRLRLTFIALTETQMLSIRSHYMGRQGSFLSFAIPNDLLSGFTTPSDFTPPSYRWIYAATPEVEDIACERYTVTVELLTVPPEGASVAGAELSVAISMAAGAAAGGADGAALTVTTSLEAGAATGS